MIRQLRELTNLERVKEQIHTSHWSRAVLKTRQKMSNPSIIFLKSLFIYFQRGEGKEKERETSMCGCLSSTPYWGSGPQARHVPWLGIEQCPFGLEACAQSTEPHQPRLYSWNKEIALLRFLVTLGEGLRGTALHSSYSVLLQVIPFFSLHRWLAEKWQIFTLGGIKQFSKHAYCTQ